MPESLSSRWWQRGLCTITFAARSENMEHILRQQGHNQNRYIPGKIQKMKSKLFPPRTDSLVIVGTFFMDRNHRL
uniref:Uncharacterized protein n=1 Tax=Terrapene triunguis TaxID=2587831 RepID=A0A674K2S2_9SAUR